MYIYTHLTILSTLSRFRNKSQQRLQTDKSGDDDVKVIYISPGIIFALDGIFGQKAALWKPQSLWRTKDKMSDNTGLMTLKVILCAHTILKQITQIRKYVVGETS